MRVRKNRSKRGKVQLCLCSLRIQGVESGWSWLNAAPETHLHFSQYGRTILKVFSTAVWYRKGIPKAFTKMDCGNKTKARGMISKWKKGEAPREGELSWEKPWVSATGDLSPLGGASGESGPCFVRDPQVTFKLDFAHRRPRIASKILENEMRCCMKVLNIMSFGGDGKCSSWGPGDRLIEWERQKKE